MLASKMSAEETRTESRTDPSEGDVALGPETPRLVVVMECDRPTAAGWRVALGEADEVVIGRGAARGIARRGRAIDLTLPDHEMSRQHVRLRRQVGGWELADLSSKNGTQVNGETVTRATLADSDLVELGGIMMMFREEGAHVRGADFGDRDLAAEGEQTPAAFRTVSIEVELRCADLARIAASTVPVLVRGETGTGKEL